MIVSGRRNTVAAHTSIDRVACRLCTWLSDLASPTLYLEISKTDSGENEQTAQLRTLMDTRWDRPTIYAKLRLCIIASPLRHDTVYDIPRDASSEGTCWNV